MPRDSDSETEVAKPIMVAKARCGAVLGLRKGVGGMYRRAGFRLRLERWVGSRGGLERCSRWGMGSRCESTIGRDCWRLGQEVNHTLTNG